MDQIRTGSLIRRLRLEQGMTQLALAERLGVSDKAVSKWDGAAVRQIADRLCHPVVARIGKRGKYHCRPIG